MVVLWVQGMRSWVQWKGRLGLRMQGWGGGPKDARKGRLGLRMQGRGGGPKDARKGRLGLRMQGRGGTMGKLIRCTLVVYHPITHASAVV